MTAFCFLLKSFSDTSALLNLLFLSEERFWMKFKSVFSSFLRVMLRAEHLCWACHVDIGKFFKSSEKLFSFILEGIDGKLSKIMLLNDWLLFVNFPNVLYGLDCLSFLFPFFTSTTNWTPSDNDTMHELSLEHFKTYYKLPRWRTFISWWGWSVFDSCRGSFSWASRTENINNASFYRL